MNDMSGRIEAAPDAHLKAAGFEFRGRFMDKCSVVEAWAVEVIAKTGKKPPYLFGLKLRAVRRIAEGQENLLRNPAKVLKLLDEFQQFADMRSVLAHSVLHIATGARGTRYLVFEPCAHPRLWADTRIAITVPETTTITDKLSSVANELSQQKLR